MTATPAGAMISGMSTATRERLSQDDAQILRLESRRDQGTHGQGPDRRARAPTGVRSPVDGLRDQVGERMAAFPRLGQRVEEPRLGLGRPAWVEAPEVDLDWHVAEPDHADPLSDEELRHAVGDLLSERLDHTRPLWRLDALPLTGGRVALVGRIHHAMADGVSAIRLVAGLLWDAEADRRLARPPGPRSGSTTGSSPAAPGRRPAASEAREARILVRLPAALWRELRPGRGHQARPAHRPGPRGRLDELPTRAAEADRARRGRGRHRQRRRPRGGRRRPSPLAAARRRRIADDLRVQCPVCLHAREEARGSSATATPS